MKALFIGGKLDGQLKDAGNIPDIYQHEEQVYKLVYPFDTCAMFMIPSDKGISPIDIIQLLMNGYSERPMLKRQIAALEDKLENAEHLFQELLLQRSK